MNAAVVRDLGHAGERTDAGAVRPDLDAGEWQPVDVDKFGGRADALLQEL